MTALDHRRRREASRRMPTLPFDHRRDPLDLTDDQRTTAVTVYLDRFSAHFGGPVPAIFRACRTVGLTPAEYMRRPGHSDQISVRLEYTDDVISQLQYGQLHPVYMIDEVPR